MNKQLKSKWVKALRSGKYKQGFGMLKQRSDTAHRPEYCCLGVLRELMPVAYQETSSTNNGGGCTLHKSQLQLADISYKVQDNLVSMNDSCRSTFNDIADYIEEKL